jgi:hypothetical protein
VSTLLGVLGAHWLFFQAPASGHEIGERLELSREEVSSLSRLKVGEAVLVLPDQRHLPGRVLLPPPWMPAFEMDMASMQRNLAMAMGATTTGEVSGRRRPHAWGAWAERESRTLGRLSRPCPLYGIEEGV